MTHQKILDHSFKFETTDFVNTRWVKVHLPYICGAEVHSTQFIKLRVYGLDELRIFKNTHPEVPELLITSLPKRGKGEDGQETKDLYVQPPVINVS